MFKKIFTTLVLAMMLITSMPSEAKFGSSSRSSFSSSRSSSSFSSSRSYSAPRPSPSYSAPVSRPSGGLSNGGNVGMQRQAVTNSVRPPTAPPSQQAYNSSRSSSYQNNQGNQSYGGGGNTTIIHSPNATQGGGGFGMGSLAMAAMGGYMLNGIMHDSHGAVYNGPGYSNGTPTPGGQYYQPQPQVQSGQSEQYSPGQQMPNQHAPESRMDTGMVALLWFIGIIAFVASVVLLRRVFF